MRKHTLVILNIVVLLALLVPTFPRASASITLSGTWYSYLVVWCGGIPMTTGSFIPFGPPPGFPPFPGNINSPPFAGWFFLADTVNLTGTWSGTLNTYSNQFSGQITGKFSGDFYDSQSFHVATMPLLSGTIPSTPITGTLSGNVIKGTAQGTFASSELVGSWVADIIIDPSYGVSSSIEFHPILIGGAYIWPYVTVLVPPIGDYTFNTTEWLYGLGTILIDGRKEKSDGDVNNDGVVNVLDRVLISAHWYPGPPLGPLGYDVNFDINKDGKTNIVELGIVSAYWTGPPKGPKAP